MRYFSFLFIIFQLLFQNCENPNSKKTQNKVAIIQKPHFEDVEKRSSTPETALIDTMVNQFIKQWEITGATLAICKDGKLVYAKGFGYADKEKNEKMNALHLLRIASVSKLFTAVGIMRLVEDGDLTLQSKVFGENGILKEYNHLIVDSLAKEITIEHLLTHTGGWRNQLRTDPMFAPVAVAQAMKLSSPISLEQTMAFMLGQKGYFKPGTFVDYSNFGYCVLGKVIEKISKKTYEKYIQENILKPIEITEMRIGKNRYTDKFPNETRYYDQPNAPKVPSIYDPKVLASRVYEGNNTENLGASGGWIASAVDLVRFACAIDGFDTFPDFLSKESIERMTFLGDLHGNTSPIPKQNLVNHKNTNTEIDTTTLDNFVDNNALETLKVLHRKVLGWKSVDGEKWWRTGNLSSTSSDLTRRHDGYTFAFITNTGSWRGPYLPYEIQGLMRRVLAQVKKFPEKDIFKNALKKIQ